MPTWSVVLTSAGIAAFVSGIISLSGQALERRSRRRELALAKALEMASKQIDMTREVAAANRQQAAIMDHVLFASTYYKWLRHLLDAGELPPDAEKMRADSEREIREFQQASGGASMDPQSHRSMLDIQ